MAKRSQQLKVQLVVAAVAVVLSGFALSAATYAWYVANNTVNAKTSTISATTNGFILQIAQKSKGAQHGGAQDSLAATELGGKITPSSTDNVVDWYACQGWGEDGKVTTYTKLNFTSGGKAGEYEAGGETHYAFLKGEYILYTISDTGFADVYLTDPSEKPVEVTVNGSATTDTIPKSLRVGLTIQDADASGNGTGAEVLKCVYAPYAVEGKGNDASAIDGWACINGSAAPVTPSYQHIEADNYGSWCASKVGEDYVAGSKAIAKRVGYNGVILRIYIWMEGTDADCVNNAAAEDTATYNVTVRLAGVSAE